MTLTLNGTRALDELPGSVIFDLDDTLYGYAAPHEAALMAVEGKVLARLNIPAAAFRAGLGIARDKVKHRLGNTASSHSRLLYFQQMLEDWGLRTQTLLSLDLEQTYWRAFLDTARLFPKAEELLVEFQAVGVRMGIVTDLTAQIQFRKIVHFGLDRYIDFVVTSEEAGQDKIGLAPFHLAAAKLALGKEAVVWAIGDQLPDLAGASEVLGAITIQKLNGTAVRHAADASFSDYADLLRHVRKLAAGNKF
jgi:FMN phosphatase YigB (HAD superfamily)